MPDSSLQPSLDYALGCPTLNLCFWKEGWTSFAGTEKREPQFCSQLNVFLHRSRTSAPSQKAPRGLECRTCWQTLVQKCNVAPSNASKSIPMLHSNKLEASQSWTKKSKIYRFPTHDWTCLPRGSTIPRPTLGVVNWCLALLRLVARGERCWQLGVQQSCGNRWEGVGIMSFCLELA